MSELINRYIKKLKSDYPEDDKMYITLKQFESEIKQQVSKDKEVEKRWDNFKPGDMK